MIGRGVGNLSTNFCISEACRDLATLIFDVGGHTLVGDTLSVSALVGLVPLTFDLLTLKLVCIIGRGVSNLSNNFDVSGTYRSRLWANICQTYHVTSRP